MLADRSDFNKGSFGVEARVQETLDRMYDDLFRVAMHLEGWWEEFRMYHRKNGVIKLVRET